MWRTSSPGDKLAGDFGNEPDATSISDRGLFRLLAGNLSPGVFRLLQHNLPIADIEPKGCLVDYLSIPNRQAEIKTRPNGTQSGIFR